MTRIIMTTHGRFCELAAHHRVVPVIHKVLADGEATLLAYRKLAADRSGTFLLESSDVGQSWSCWSLIGCGSRAALTVDDAGETVQIGNAPSGAPEGRNPLDALRRTPELLRTELPLADDASVPKLTSGLVGYFGHDIVHYIEPHLPDTTDNDLQIPELMQLLMEDLAAFDHHEGMLQLISNAVNWDGSDERIDQAYDTACDRVNAMVEQLSESPNLRPVEVSFPKPVIQRQRAAEDHTDRIERCKDHIHAGDAFQIVLSQRFEMDTQTSAFGIYRISRTSNPSPYMFLVNVPAKDFSDTTFQIVDSSSESLVAVQGSEAITNPIAGTRPRDATVEQDNALEADLLADEKENSEYLMLVDLGRNDLGRAYRPGSVVMHDFRHIECYSHVMHLVSTVTGELSSDATTAGAFVATFPAGALSGAPKPSALSIIDKFEGTHRGVHGDTVGYFDFRGNIDQAIAIRMGVKKDDTVYVQVGGGIVSGSDPIAEDEETRNKAAAVLRAVAAAETLVSAERS